MGQKLWNIALGTAFILSVLACKQESKHPKKEIVEIQFIKEGDLSLSNNDSIVKNLEIEIADTDTERNNGLMNRSKMAENRGMLFIFQEDNNTTFWMKNTRIPLDIIFLGADSTIITIQKNAKPYDTTPNKYGSAAPYRYVLEVNGGKADEWGLKEGKTKINWTKN